MNNKKFRDIKIESGIPIPPVVRRHRVSFAQVLRNLWSSMAPGDSILLESKKEAAIFASLAGREGWRSTRRTLDGEYVRVWKRADGDDPLRDEIDRELYRGSG